MINPSDLTPEFLEDNGIRTKNLIFGPSFLPYNPNLKQFSRDLRNDGVTAEILLWKQLRGKRIGYTFNRQKPILNYIADFYCKALDLVVEIDGSSHYSVESQERDAERDRQMNVLGLKVIRVPDRDVKMNPQQVACDILIKAKEVAINIDKKKNQQDKYYRHVPENNQLVCEISAEVSA